MKNNAIMVDVDPEIFRCVCELYMTWRCMSFLRILCTTATAVANEVFQHTNVLRPTWLTNSMRNETPTDER